VHPPKGKGSAGGAVEETEEAAPPEEDGWLEVGRRNKMVVTRTVCTRFPSPPVFFTPYMRGWFADDGLVAWIDR
jgi:ubiquitin carboxyl-terminal hydrolase 10